MILALVLLVSLAACGRDDRSSVYWLNFKPEIDETLRTLAAEYTEKTGIEVKIVTAASGSYEVTLTSEMDKSNPPWTIPVIYLRFGVGLAIFMLVGFSKSIPIEIEEAASIDGCGPVRTFFLVVLPMLKPTLISVGILEIMWVWNDYLLPYPVLDINKYRTIPIHIQYLKGSYGTVDLGATMALIFLSIVPVIIFYLICQKYIIKGVASGAVKG